MAKKTLLILISLLSACTLSPIKNAQDDIANIEIPKEWMLAQENNAQAQNAPWWTNYQSPTLNQLINEAMQHNSELQSAALNWQISRIGIDEAALNQTPTFTGNLSASANRNFSENNNTRQFSSGLNASWQLDLWQKLSASTQSAIWTANASAEDLLATRLSIQGEVVSAYLTLLYNQERLNLNQQQINYQEKSQQIMQARESAGNASQLDVLNNKQSLDTLKRERIALKANLEQAQNSLSILLGRPPQEITITERIYDLAQAPINAQLPARLLSQRPDLRAAQYRLQAALGEIAVSERDFYPDLNLSASLSTGGNILSEILKNPIGAIASTIELPFLQIREKRLALERSELNYQQLLANFKNTLYQAFADVENALSNLQSVETQAPLYAQSLKEAEKILELTQIRYAQGADSLQTLLDAEESKRNAESALLDNHYNRLNARLNLHLSLGGNTTETKP